MCRKAGDNVPTVPPSPLPGGHNTTNGPWPQTFGYTATREKPFFKYYYIFAMLDARDVGFMHRALISVSEAQKGVHFNP